MCIRDSPYIVLLDISNNLFGRQGLDNILEALKYNTSLKCLCIARCKLEDEDAKHIGDILTFNTTLEQLDLRCNIIGDIGIKALASALDKNSTLKRINISSNYYSPKILSKLETLQSRMGIIAEVNC